MTASPLPSLASLLDDAKCFELIRQHRWPDGTRCPRCDSGSVVRDGHDETQRHRQRHLCKDRGARFDDLSGTVLAGRRQPLRLWVLCLYFMGLNLSNSQIARELGLNGNDVQGMVSHLREGLTAKAPGETLEGVVEIGEAHVVAGHKGNPAAVQKKTGRDGGGASKGSAAAARWKRRIRRSPA